MAKANRKFRMRDDDEAVVGIGTLIVFVATILVAAIASGVIIKTAYSLKDQAEKTGLAARQEVTGGPKVIDIVGDRGTTLPLDKILQVKFTITNWEGSDAINIDTMVVHWMSNGKNVYLTNNPGPGANFWRQPTSLYFGCEEIPAEATPGTNGFDPGAATPRWYLDDDNNLYVAINLKVAGDLTYPGINDELKPNTHVSVVFIPAHGPPVTEEFITPMDYGGDQVEFLDLTNT
jgi:archaellin